VSWCAHVFGILISLRYWRMYSNFYVFDLFIFAFMFNNLETDSLIMIMILDFKYFYFVDKHILAH